MASRTEDLFPHNLFDGSTPEPMEGFDIAALEENKKKENNRKEAQKILAEFEPDESPLFADSTTDAEPKNVESEKMSQEELFGKTSSQESLFHLFPDLPGSESKPLPSSEIQLEDVEDFESTKNFENAENFEDSSSEKDKRSEGISNQKIALAILAGSFLVAGTVALFVFCPPAAAAALFVGSKIGAATGLTAAAHAAIPLIVGAAKVAGSAIIGTAATAGSAITGVAATAGSAITGVAATAGSAITGVAATAGSAITGTASIAAHAAMPVAHVAQAAGSAMAHTAGAIGSSLTHAAATAGSTLTQAAATAGSAITHAAGTVAQAAMPVASAAKTTGSAMAQTASTAMQSTIGRLALTATAGIAATGAIKGMSSLLSTAAQKIQGLMASDDANKQKSQDREMTTLSSSASTLTSTN